MSLKYCTFCHNNQRRKTLCICTSLAYINIYQNKSKLSQWLLLPSPVSLPEDCCKGWANSLFPTLLHESPEWLETFIVTMVRGLYLPYITPRDILTVLWRVLFGGGEVEGGRRRGFKRYPILIFLPFPLVLRIVFANSLIVFKRMTQCHQCHQYR